MVSLGRVRTGSQIIKNTPAENSSGFYISERCRVMDMKERTEDKGRYLQRNTIDVSAIVQYQEVAWCANDSKGEVNGKRPEDGANNEQIMSK